MNIIEVGGKVPSETTTLNAIPVGTVFSGTIRGRVSGALYSGIFFKANDAWRLEGVTKSYDCLVVSLENSYIGRMDYANVFVDCTTVYDYEVLDVDLVIKKRGKG